MTDPTEQEIAAVSTAPRVTQADIEANIASEHYFTAMNGVEGVDPKATVYGTSDEDIPDELGRLTFCVLVLKNGFTVTGESVGASHGNFDPQIGIKVSRANEIARENAIQKLWPLMGYALKQDLHRAKGSN